MSSVSLATRKYFTRNSNKGSTSYSDADIATDTYTSGPYDKNDSHMNTKKTKLINDDITIIPTLEAIDDVQPIVAPELTNLWSHDQEPTTTSTPISTNKGKLPDSDNQQVSGNQSKASMIDFQNIQVIDNQFKDKEHFFTTVHKLFIPKIELPYAESNLILEN